MPPRFVSYVSHIALCAPLAGCSFVFANDAPPAEHAARQAAASGYIDCTRSRALPIVDTVVAGLQAVRTIVAFLVPDSFYDNVFLSREADIGIGLGFVAVFGASSVYGWSVVDECRALYDEHLPRPQ